MPAHTLPIGTYIYLTILRIMPQGAYLDDGADGILLPTRFLPADAKVSDDVQVLIYHDKEGFLIATTQQAYGEVGDIVALKVVSTTDKGAYLDMGIMKDLYLPLALQIEEVEAGDTCLVKILVDKSSGRLIATQALDGYLSNHQLSVQDNEAVEIIIYRKTPLGYAVIINDQHLGLLYHNEIFQEIQIGSRLQAYIKRIHEDQKIDVSLKAQGFQSIASETDKILQLLQEHNGYLPYHDGSPADEIYTFFQMSKKSYKKAIGVLYKNGDIAILDKGIQLMITD